MKKIAPLREEFLTAILKGRTIPLHAELDAALITPLTALRALRQFGHPVLLESARVNERTGRYSFVTADPYLIFRSQGDTVDLDWMAAPQGKYGKRASLKRKPLLKLRELMANYRTARVETALRPKWRSSQPPTLFLVHDTALVAPLEAALGSAYAASEEWDPAHAVRAWLFQPRSTGPGL